MSLSGSDDDLQVDDFEDNWRPAQLACVEQEDRQRRQDRLNSTDEERRKCVLCEMEDTSVPGAKPMVAEALLMEKKHMRTMADKTRYKFLKNKLNRVLAYSQKTPEGRKVNFPKITCRAIRRHYAEGHDKDPIRSLCRQIDYMEKSIEQMQRGSLWKKNTTSPELGMVPDVANHNLYMKMCQQLQTMNQAVVKLQTQNDAKRVGGRKSSVPPIFRVNVRG